MDAQNDNTCFIHNAKNNDISQMPRVSQLLVHVTYQTPRDRQVLACFNLFCYASPINKET